VLEAVRRFYHWSFGYEIHVYSDHNPLACLTDAALQSAKLLQWSSALQTFDLYFHYNGGKTPTLAAPDCLFHLRPDMDRGTTSA
jgi:RNase H-like domain found in reverse transcriptase